MYKSNFGIKNCHGQGCDSSSDMSFEVVSVCKEIENICEKTVYTHCCGHNISLVITTVCKIPIVQNSLDIVKGVTMMFVKLNLRVK